MTIGRIPNLTNWQAFDFRLAFPVQSVERLQRLRFLLERHARNSDVMSQAGYSWVRRSSPSWHTLFPDFADWVAAHPPDPGPGPRAGKGGRSEKAASESSSSDAEAEQK